MDELDYIILNMVNKNGKMAKENILKVLCMSKLEKIKLIKYLNILYLKYGIIPSDDRLKGEILRILKEDK